MSRDANYNSKRRVDFGKFQRSSYWDNKDKPMTATEVIESWDRMKITPYGYCPICGVGGFSRERTPNGRDECKNHHVYLSSESVTSPVS